VWNKLQGSCLEGVDHVDGVLLSNVVDTITAHTLDSATSKAADVCSDCSSSSDRLACYCTRAVQNALHYCVRRASPPTHVCFLAAPSLLLLLAVTLLPVQPCLLLL
jgi:hypothetical protein